VLTIGNFLLLLPLLPLQMVSLTLLLWTRDGAAGAAMEAAAVAGVPLLGVASYLTAHSLAVYLRGLWRFMV
jgi:CDP-diacylglycerol--glycerol-3-phosphate 3-phosphatidyltransferase